jgi:predicted ATPase
MIARRLDRLSERARMLLRVAAVIGREFEFGLLQRAAGLGEPEAADGLEELVRRRVLHGVGDRFDFRHERIRDVVVAELPTPSRQLLHARVAAALEGLAGGDLLDHCAALGAHYRQAGIWDKAVVPSARRRREVSSRSAFAATMVPPTSTAKRASTAAASAPLTRPPSGSRFQQSA